MWIMTNNGYLSIVSKDCGPAELLVRARRAVDAVMDGGKVTLEPPPSRRCSIFC